MSLVSKECVDFVKGFEGFSATPYNDCVGVKTLGYGMTGAEIQGINYVTEEQATQMLENLLNNSYATPIKNDLDSKGVTLTQNQFDAFVSMAYNIGVGGLLSSTLYSNVVAGVRDQATITENFQRWSKAGNKTLEGLYRRRTAEAEMFFRNDAVDNPITIVTDPKLNTAIQALQYDLNSDYNAQLKYIDGNIYQETLDNLEAVGKLITKGHKSYVVLWIQQKLIGWGYLKNGQDSGTYDEPTFQAVTNLQKNWGRETSGKILVSNNTWSIFLNN